MHKLYLNQKVLALRDRFAILDERDNPVYHAVGSVFRIPKHFDILDLNDRIVASVTKKPFALLPQFTLEIDGRSVATIQKRFTFLKPRYDLKAAGLTVSGDFWDMNFDVLRQGTAVGQIRKRWFSVGDKYEITIFDDQEELLLVGLVIAIDYVKKQADAAASSAAARN
ncbi:LURP-one-related/scramblase family protein [Levilactobacillus huananensis]|uniref:LURP-one-related/scramblase family protein n=1 Tax=Levilactobacillus huananensis TaxID=2486019 RepID=UPI0013DE4E2C|nr:LURP-one-related family protein [Levilactobacillus huananensis]